jgi:hypothetical protein
MEVIEVRKNAASRRGRWSCLKMKDEDWFTANQVDLWWDPSA